jgi:D-arabinose 1-dehydrogenase-like Zn-dependent alcohol dehydrogenase
MATTIAVGTMKVAQISKPGAGFEIVEREIPEPGAGEVRIRVQACGVCHSDIFVKEGPLAGDSVSAGAWARSGRHRR